MTEATDLTEPTDLTGPTEDRLRAELASARAVIDGLADDYRQIVDAAVGSNGDDEHDIEGASIAFERAQVDSQRQRAEARVQAVQGALVRLAAGGYGRCLRCGGQIAPARLSALPSVETCIGCAR